VHTSVLRRSIRTCELALNVADRHWIPVRRSWRLNERHYGALQGKNKKQTLDTYGEEQFMLWRRSYDVPPPPIADDDEFSQVGDPRYADLAPELMPRTECLKDVLARVLPYWYERDPARSAHRRHRAGGGPRQLATGARQAPRTRSSDEAIAALNIPTGMSAAVRPRPLDAAPRSRPVGSTSIPRRRLRPRRRWPTKVR
jgi:2,3-bisphosphoglycerate-dependent phosphoglycerate mutase